MSALTDGVAHCQSAGLGMSACLDYLGSLHACGAGVPIGASFPDQTHVNFFCGSIPTAAEAATLLSIAEANKNAAIAASGTDNGAPWWVWAALAIAIAGGAIWYVTR